MPVFDSGFIHGVSVAEQVRTFGSRPFLLDRHYARWQRGLELIGLDPPCSFEDLERRITQLVRLNARLLPEGAEQGICFFATPGNQASLLWSRETPTTRFFAHTYPLPIERWQASYERGVALVTTPIRDVPDECWPKSVKIRSRLHYFLAQRAADGMQPGAFPILLDQEGWVADSAIASIAGYTSQSGLIVHPKFDRFDSISIEFLTGLAEEMGLRVSEQKFSVPELCRFDEVFLVTTPWCIFPVATIDGQAIKRQSTFPIFSRLMSAWSKAVGNSTSFK